MSWEALASLPIDSTRRTWRLRCREDDMRLEVLWFCVSDAFLTEQGRQREADNLRHEIDETRREIDVTLSLFLF